VGGGGVGGRGSTLFMTTRSDASASKAMPLVSTNLIRLAPTPARTPMCASKIGGGEGGRECEAHMQRACFTAGGRVCAADRSLLLCWRCEHSDDRRRLDAPFDGQVPFVWFNPGLKRR